jgi:Bacteriocin-protection, YdeI or OmpD-Associated/Domain of unknown function (DUF1905)
VRFEADVAEFGSALAIDLPFDPKQEFGKVRAPVRVTINWYEFPTTVASMSGRIVVGLNKEVRVRAGVAAGDRVVVEIVLDEGPRTVEIPADLAEALDAESAAFLDSLSYTHRKEYVRWIEEAKRPQTRRLRIEKTVAMLHERTRHP